MYKVVIQTEYYTKTSTGSQFSFPAEKQYRDATNEFATALGLSYNSEGNYYYAYGEKGTTPDFSALDTLPAVYGLVGGAYPTTQIAAETVTYTIKYDINEAALGYSLSNIKVSWTYDNTTYHIGLVKEADHAGLKIVVDNGHKGYAATALDITFDIDLSLYETVKIAYTAKFDATTKNFKWIINDDSNTFVMNSIGTSYTSYEVDLLAKMSGTGTLTRVYTRPTSLDDDGNSLELFLDSITLVAKS